MKNRGNIAIRIGMAVLVILYVIALTASLIGSGPTVEDLQGDIRDLQSEFCLQRAMCIRYRLGSVLMYTN